MRHEAVFSRGACGGRWIALLALSVFLVACGRSDEPGSGAPADRSAATPAVKVLVKLDPALTAKVSPDDKVFVFARAADGPKAPLAVVQKQVKDLPAVVTLDDSDAMMPEGRISAFPELVFGARVSRSGDAMSKPGDLEGLSGPVRAADAGTVEVIIAREVAGKPALPDLLPLLADAGSSGGANHAASERRLALRMPPEVLARWTAVDLALTGPDGETRTLRVPVGSEAAVQGTATTVRVVAFAPAFQIRENAITSGSNEPDNPAALVRVRDSAQPAGEGWVFQKFPEFNTYKGGSVHVRLIGGHAAAGK